MTATRSEFAWLKGLYDIDQVGYRPPDSTLLYHAKQHIDSANVLISLVDGLPMGPALKIKVLADQSIKQQLSQAMVQVDTWIADYLHGKDLPFADVFVPWNT